MGKPNGNGACSPVLCRLKNNERSHPENRIVDIPLEQMRGWTKSLSPEHRQHRSLHLARLIFDRCITNVSQMRGLNTFAAGKH